MGNRRCIPLYVVIAACVVTLVWWVCQGHQDRQAAAPNRAPAPRFETGPSSGTTPSTEPSVQDNGSPETSGDSSNHGRDVAASTLPPPPANDPQALALWARERLEDAWKLEMDLVGPDAQLEFPQGADVPWVKLTPTEASRRRHEIFSRLKTIWEAARKDDVVMRAFTAVANDASAPPHRRRLAMTILGCLPQEEALEALAQIFRTDPDPKIRLIALEGVGAGQGRFFQQIDYDTREGSVQEGFFTNAFPPLRPSGVRTSTPIGRGKSLSIILDAVTRETDTTVRLRALELLAASLPGNEASLPPIDPSDPPNQQDALNRVLYVARQDRDPAIRERAVSILCPWPTQPDVLTLLTDLARHDTAPSVRKTAICRLGLVGDWWTAESMNQTPEIQVAFQLLSDVARDPAQPGDTRAIALQSLSRGWIEHYEPVARFYEQFIQSDQEPSMRALAISIYARDSSAIPLLERVAATDSSENVRGAAQERLQWIRTRR